MLLRYTSLLSYTHIIITWYMNTYETWYMIYDTHTHTTLPSFCQHISRFLLLNQPWRVPGSPQSSPRSDFSEAAVTSCYSSLDLATVLDMTPPTPNQMPLNLGLKRWVFSILGIQHHDLMEMILKKHIYITHVCIYIYVHVYIHKLMCYEEL